jgi:protein required for attachment to host cells
MKGTIWVVVADATCARIFSAADPGAELTEREDLLHTASRAQSTSLTTDRSGRDTDVQHTGSHTMGHEQSIKEHELQRFAREISDTLDHHCQQQHFYRLHLLASPQLLGLLRKALSQNTLAITAGETDINLVKEKPSIIRQHLPRRL